MSTTQSPSPASSIRSSRTGSTTENDELLSGVQAGCNSSDQCQLRNDGEDFHINWTTRRELRILGREGLVAVSIAAISDRDRYKGERIDAGLLVADTVEYFGGESFGTATRIVPNQLKYSTQDGTTAWPWGEIEPILKGFAVRYKAYVRKVGVSEARAKLRFRSLTNRPISDNVEKAVAYLAGDVSIKLGAHARKATTEIPAATGHNGESLAAFLKLVELSGSSETREAIAAAAAGEASGFIPSVVRDPVTPLRDLVRRFGTSTHGQDPTIRRETVLHAFGVDDPGKLFPAQPEFEHVPDAVERRQETDLAAFIRGTTGPMLVTASGGTGRSIVAQRVPRLLQHCSEDSTGRSDATSGGSLVRPDPKAVAADRNLAGSTEASADGHSADVSYASLEHFPAAQSVRSRPSDPLPR